MEWGRGEGPAEPAVPEQRPRRSANCTAMPTGPASTRRWGPVPACSRAECPGGGPGCVPARPRRSPGTPASPRWCRTAGPGAAQSPWTCFAAAVRGEGAQRKKQHERHDSAAPRADARPVASGERPAPVPRRASGGRRRAPAVRSQPPTHLIRCQPTLPSCVPILKLRAQLAVCSQLHVQLALHFPSLAQAGWAWRRWHCMSWEPLISTISALQEASRPMAERPPLVAAPPTAHEPDRVEAGRVSLACGGGGRIGRYQHERQPTSRAAGV